MGSMYSWQNRRAFVVLPEHVKKIGVINRSLPTKENTGWATLESVISGEGILEDKNGSKAAIYGVTAELNKTGFVQAVAMTDIILSGRGAGLINPPLTPELVDSIAEVNQFDALLVLEAFDTDQRNSNTGQMVGDIFNAVITGDIKQIDPIPRSNGSAEVYVKMNWRLYESGRYQILDEAQYGDYFLSGKYNYDFAEFGKRSDIEQCAYYGGCAYVSRFFPHRVKVYRDFFRRGSPELLSAARMLDVADFSGSKRVWESLLNHPKPKVAGRAYFNAAIGYEMDGDIEKALELVQKSYAVYRIPQARHYADLLFTFKNQMR